MVQVRQHAAADAAAGCGQWGRRGHSQQPVRSLLWAGGTSALVKTPEHANNLLKSHNGSPQAGCREQITVGTGTGRKSNAPAPTPGLTALSPELLAKSFCFKVTKQDWLAAEPARSAPSGLKQGDSFTAPGQAQDKSFQTGLQWTSHPAHSG